MSINRVCISGNLTRDAELRSTQSGMSILGLGVAVNERRKNAGGEWEDYPNFVDCTMFGTRAEKLQPYLVKGVKVSIEGKLRYSSWEDKQGGRRSKLEVIVDEVEFMSRKDGAQAPAAPQAGGYAPQPHTPPQSAGYAPQAALCDEDIPF